MATTPEDAYGWHLLGTARYRNGRLTPAIEAFRRRLELQPDDAVGNYSLAIALRDLGERDEARQFMRRAVQLNPNWEQAQNRLRDLEKPPPPTPPPPPLKSPTLEPAGTIVGQAREVQKGVASSSSIIRGGTLQKWTFRVVRDNEAANAPRPVPVEIKGGRIDGTLIEGDRVQIPTGRWRPGSTLRVHAFQNLTTQETVRARNLGRRIAAAFFAAAILAIGSMVVWGISTELSDPTPKPTVQPNPPPATAPQPPPPSNPQPPPASETPPPPPAQAEGDPEAGKAVFASEDCGSCHTLADAGSNGVIGPNLDEAMPDHELVVERVTNGSGAMPSFKDHLTEEQITEVADYVVAATSGSS
jgi:cytochrome c6